MSAEVGRWPRRQAGRLIVGGQRNQPTLRITLQDGKAAKVEKLSLPISEVMGIHHMADRLETEEGLLLRAIQQEEIGALSYAGKNLMRVIRSRRKTERQIR